MGQPLDKSKAIELLRTGPDGVRKWNRLRRDGMGNITHFESHEYFHHFPFARGEQEMTREEAESFAVCYSLMCSDTQPDLSNSNFDGLDLSGADFSGANLWRSTFNGSILRDCSFRGCEDPFAGLPCNLPEVDFSSADCTRADFSFANFSSPLPVFDDMAHFARTNLTEAIFRRSDLSQANFDEAILHFTKFEAISRPPDTRLVRLVGTGIDSDSVSLGVDAERQLLLRIFHTVSIPISTDESWAERSLRQLSAQVGRTILSDVLLLGVRRCGGAIELWLATSFKAESSVVLNDLLRTHTWLRPNPAALTELLPPSILTGAKVVFLNYTNVDNSILVGSAVGHDNRVNTPSP